MKRRSELISRARKWRNFEYTYCERGSCTPPKRLEVHFELIQASSQSLVVKAAELSDPPAKCRFCSSCEQRRFSYCQSRTPPNRLNIDYDAIRTSFGSDAVKRCRIDDAANQMSDFSRHSNNDRFRTASPAPRSGYSTSNFTLCRRDLTALWRNGGESTTAQMKFQVRSPSSNAKRGEEAQTQVSSRRSARRLVSLSCFSIRYHNSVYIVTAQKEWYE